MQTQYHWEYHGDGIYLGNGITRYEMGTCCNGNGVEIQYTSGMEWRQGIMGIEWKHGIRG